MAARITAHYRSHGFFVAQAYLPAQDIRDGAVTIAVSEGRLGRVQLRNESRLPDAAVRSALAGLESGDVITTDAFEGRLLLSDLPGANVRSTLVPGSAAGTSDLMVELADNATRRCEALPAADRPACVQRLMGAGNTEGSIDAGGVNRRSETPVR